MMAYFPLHLMYISLKSKFPIVLEFSSTPIVCHRVNHNIYNKILLMCESVMTGLHSNFVTDKSDATTIQSASNDSLHTQKTISRLCMRSHAVVTVTSLIGICW